MVFSLADPPYMKFSLLGPLCDSILHAPLAATRLGSVGLRKTISSLTQARGRSQIAAKDNLLMGPRCWAR